MDEGSGGNAAAYTNQGYLDRASDPRVPVHCGAGYREERGGRMRMISDEEDYRAPRGRFDDTRRSDESYSHGGGKHHRRSRHGCARRSEQRPERSSRDRYSEACDSTSRHNFEPDINHTMLHTYDLSAILRDRSESSTRDREYSGRRTASARASERYRGERTRGRRVEDYSSSRRRVEDYSPTRRREETYDTNAPLCEYSDRQTTRSRYRRGGAPYDSTSTDKSFEPAGERIEITLSEQPSRARGGYDYADDYDSDGDYEYDHTDLRSFRPDDDPRQLNVCAHTVNHVPFVRGGTIGQLREHLARNLCPKFADSSAYLQLNGVRTDLDSDYKVIAASQMCASDSPPSVDNRIPTIHFELPNDTQPSHFSNEAVMRYRQCGGAHPSLVVSQADIDNDDFSVRVAYPHHFSMFYPNRVYGRSGAREATIMDVTRAVGRAACKETKDCYLYRDTSKNPPYHLAYGTSGRRGVLNHLNHRIGENPSCAFLPELDKLTRGTNGSMAHTAVIYVLPDKFD